MGKAKLDHAADALLADVPRDRDAPHYRENTFRRKLDLAARRESSQPLPKIREGSVYLLQKEWLEITESARLTQRQSDVLRLRLEGHTFEEIGQRFGHTKQGAQRIYHQGAKKLARAWITYPYRGLPSTYESEVTRGLPVGRTQ